MRVFGMAILQPPSGGQISPDSPLRTFFTLFEALFLLFTTIYSGALESYLTVPVYTKPIDTLEELHESGIPWAADHEAWVYSIEGATDPTIVSLLERFEIHSDDVLAKLGAEGKYGLTIEIMAAGHVTYQQHLTGDMVFDHHVMKGSLYHTSLITVTRKSGPYSEEFDTMVGRCLAGGLLLLWEGVVAISHLSSRLQVAVETSRSNKLHHPDPKSLSIHHTQGAFFILVLGLAFAFILLTFEILMHRKNRKKQIILMEKNNP